MPGIAGQLHDVEGQRGQVLQEGGQAVHGQPPVADPGGTLAAGPLGGPGLLHGGGALGPGALGIIVVEQHRRQASAQMPLDMAGQGAQEHVGADPVGAVDIHRPHIEPGGLEGAEGALDP